MINDIRCIKWINKFIRNIQLDNIKQILSNGAIKQFFKFKKQTEIST